MGLNRTMQDDEERADSGSFSMAAVQLEEKIDFQPWVHNELPFSLVPYWQVSSPGTLRISISLESSDRVSATTVGELACDLLVDTDFSTGCSSLVSCIACEIKYVAPRRVTRTVLKSHHI